MRCWPWSAIVCTQYLLMWPYCFHCVGESEVELAWLHVLVQEHVQITENVQWSPALQTALKSRSQMYLHMFVYNQNPEYRNPVFCKADKFPSPTVPIKLYKIHSIIWLIVCRFRKIVYHIRWIQRLGVILTLLLIMLTFLNPIRRNGLKMCAHRPSIYTLGQAKYIYSFASAPASSQFSSQRSLIHYILCPLTLIDTSGVLIMQRIIIPPTRT